MAQVIVTKFCAPTNTKGARIKATSWMGATYFALDYSLGSTENHAAAIDDHIQRKLNAFPWEVYALAENTDGTGKVAIIKSAEGFDNVMTATKLLETNYA